MDGKKWIIAFLILYLVLGGITVGVYAADTGYLNLAKVSGKTGGEKAPEADSAWEKVTESEAPGISPPEQVILTPATDTTETGITETEPVKETEVQAPAETETVAPETEKAADGSETVSEDAAEADTASASDPAGAEGTDPVAQGSTEESPDETKLTEQDTGAAEDTVAKESEEVKPGAYYKYTVTEIPFEDLAIHPDVDGHNGQIGYLKPGMSGYVIGRGQWRTLIEYDGKFGYISNKYSYLTEVPEKEYPEELKKYSWDGSVAAAARLKGEIPEYANGLKDQQNTETGTH